MPGTDFYSVAAERTQSTGLRNLLQQLASRAETLAGLQRELQEAIMRNREVRTGKPVRFSKKAKKTIREFEQDAREASQGLSERVAKLSDESLLRIALTSERQQLSMEEQLYATFHEDDKKAANRVLEFRRKTIDVIERYVEGSEFKGSVTIKHVQS